MQVNGVILKTLTQKVKKNQQQHEQPQQQQQQQWWKKKTNMDEFINCIAFFTREA